jgi:hypothetical protein
VPRSGESIVTKRPSKIGLFESGVVTRRASYTCRTALQFDERSGHRIHATPEIGQGSIWWVADVEMNMDLTDVVTLLGALSEIPGRVARMEQTVSEPPAKIEALRLASLPLLTTVPDAAAICRVRSYQRCAGG